MKFLPIVILSVCMGLQTHAQFGFKDLPVDWKDFTLTDRISANAHGTAAISVHTAYSWESTTRGRKVTIDFTSTVTTQKDQSFVLRSFMKTADAERKAKLLRHEQGHYLIALLKNLWLKESLSGYKFTRNYKTEIRQVCRNVEEKARRFNDAYDAETTHSLDEEKQEEWETRLLTLLNSLSKDEKKLPVHFNLRLEFEI